MNLSSLARRPLGFVVSTCGASLALLSLLAVACGGDNVSVGGADRAALGTPPAESCEGQACDTAPSAPAPSASAPSALPSCEGKACGTDCTAAGTSDYHWCDAQGACVPGGGPTAGAPLCTPSSPPLHDGLGEGGEDGVQSGAPAVGPPPGTQAPCASHQW